MARRSNEERLAALDAKVAQLTARRDQLARQAQRERRKQQERIWIRVGRGMAELGVDSETKWEALRALVVDDPHWQQWMFQIGAEQKGERSES